MAKRNKVLVITSKDDPHADIIISKINLLGLGDRVVRFNTEDFQSNCLFTYQNSFSELYFLDSDKKIESREILSVWYRRPKDVILDTALEPYNKFIQEQTKATLKGFYFATHFTCKWINPLDSLYKARLKIQQLELAKRLGFNLPETIVTTSEKHLADFFSKHDLISTKSLDYPNTIVEGKIIPLYNRIISKENFFKNISFIKYCPTIFQRYIEKQFDIRVIIIGKEISAFAIYSQNSEGAIEDVRGESARNLKHEKIKLPDEIELQILRFMNQQKLVFSAMDLILGKDNKYYFLENNPNGQWLWLEESANFNLSDIFIRFLYANKL